MLSGFELYPSLGAPDLSPSIPDDWEYHRFRVFRPLFISRQNLGQSGNSKIPRSSGIFQTYENQALVTLLQNELNSTVAGYTNHVQTC